MRLKSVRSGLVLVTASAVALGVLSAVTATPASSAPVNAGAQQGADLSRPEAVSAALAARVSGRRVLVTGLSTETSSTWVNPDGSFSTDSSSLPTQAQVSPGVWRALDETLTAQPDGSVVPAVSVTGDRFGKPGSAAAVRMGAGLDSAGLDWLAGLPSPTVSGPVATYPNVLPGTDLTATATATGFELSLVVKAKPVGSLPATLSLPLKGTGLTWSLTDSGVLLGADASGTTIVTSSGALAYDATRDEHTGQSLHSTPLNLSLSGTAGAQKLNVTVPSALLSDPATVFPVTIDPSTSWSKTAHTYVDSGFATTSYYNANVLLGVGTYNGGGNKNRTMFAFNTANILGKHVLSATINLNEAGSWNCTAQPFDLWSVGAFGSSTTWNTQPAVATKWQTITAAKGYSSACPGGNITGDMTGWAAAVAAGSNSTSYLELRAQSETDNNQWKKFNPAAIVSLTYNSYPGQAAGRSISPCGSPCGSPALTNTTTPSLSAYTTDPDGQTLRYYFEVYAGTSASPTTLASSGSIAVAPGVMAYWHPSGLSNGSTYEYRVRAWDAIDYGPWSAGYAQFTVDTSAPVAPVISSTTHASGVWTNASTGSFSWTDSSTDRYQYSYSLDGATPSAWSSGTSVTFTGLSNAYHTLQVRVSDHAGNVSPYGTYQFGAGTGSLSSPADQDRTQARVTLTTVGPPAYGYVAYQWRRGSTAAWATVPLTDLTTAAGGAGPASYPTPVAASWVWNVVSTAGNSDGLIQARACLYLSVTDPSPVCQGSPTNVQLAVKTFGASYATTPVGPGTVSLATGDFSVSATDVSVGSYLGSLSLSRSLTTLAPAGESAAATGVFGPGWTAALTGPDAGAADQTLTDQSADGYYLLTGADGGSSVYALTPAAGGATYKGVGDADDGSVLTKIDASHVSLTDTDGTITNWIKSGTAWQVDTVVEPGSATTTTYSYVGGYVSRILGAIPAGVTTCVTSPDTTPGCRSLILTYATIAGHNRLTSVSLSAPVTAGVSAITPVQSYDYDSSGLLIGAYDPRITPHLETAYSYDSNGRLATLTPPGLAAWSMHYDSTGCAATPPATTCGRLTSVTRPDATLAQTATTSLLYDLPTGGAGAPDLPDLTTATTAKWNQKTDLPQSGTGVAIFGPNHIPASPPISTDWPFANLTYLDVNGRAVDSADFGAGDWQITSTRYDQNGNTIWSLDAGNRAQTLTPTADTDPAVAAMPNTYDRADALATITTYNAGAGAQFDGDQTVVTDTLGPQHPVQLADGSSISARAHTHTHYDDGAPTTGGPFRLPTTVTNTMQDGAGIEHDPRITRMGYAKINSSDPNEADGWSLHQATTTTTQMGSSTDLVRTTRYNLSGQQIEARLPAVASGGAAGDTTTTYYAATGTGACVSPAQAGLVCSVGPAAQPSSGNPLPVTTTTYDPSDQPLTVAETAGSTVRTTTNTYDSGERLTGTSIAVTPTAAGGTPLPTVTTSYDSATGLPTTRTAGGQTLTSGYDSLGRLTSYTDATGNTASTSYDLSGRVASINDGKATTTYTYDGSGTGEHRGLVTSEDLGVGSAPGTFTASYNPAGQPATITYPSGLTATTNYDNAGNDTALTYSQAGTTWYEFTQSPGSDGNTAGQTSPASSQQFSYDQAGRLTQTQDTVPDPGSGTTSCTTRAYTLDANSNRTTLNSYPDDGSNPSTGNCTTATTPTSWAGGYDQADRLTNTGYSYDTLGRTTAMPAVDAQGIGSHAATTGDLAIGYYSNDFVASQTQGGRTLGFTLDPLQNRVISSTDTAGATSTNHYADSSDSPAWTSTPTSWTRNLIGPTGSLAATIDQTGTVTLDLTNMHGDIIDTAAGDPAAPGGNGYTETTEYGTPRSPTTAPDTYGWLGTKRRSSNALAGLTLMGLRLYNPTTGRFLSTDPVPGGNDNPYVYVTNPTDQFDINGDCHWCHRAWHWVTHHKLDIALTIASFVPVVGEVAWAVRGARFATWAARSRWVGTGSRLFGRGGGYGYKGIFNRGPVRTGWGWNGTRNTFRTSIGWHPRQQTTVFRSFIGHRHWDWF